MTQLQRRIGAGRAVMIGLASMIGAGVFFVWAPASAAAGNGLLIGLGIATVVAALNALSTAQLAMAYPVSGGAYAYGRASVGPWTGYAAGWLFLTGKIASAGAIALIAGSYLSPGAARPLAVLVVVVLAAINASGIRSTAAVSTVVVIIVLAGIVAVAIAALTQGATLRPLALDVASGPYGILQSAGLLFFTFAGYARMATLGEEVIDPRHTLPRAIIAALAITFVVYAGVGILCLAVLGPTLAHAASPVADLVPSAWRPAVRALAGLASLGSLVGVLAGLSRTGLAMARERDLPGPLARISPRTHAPIVAEIVIAALVVAGILLLDPARLIGFSSCAVLLYYSVAHLSALRQGAAGRWLPRAVQWVGLVGCLTLSLTLPWQAVVGTAVVLAVGLGVRWVTRRVGVG